MRQQHHVLVLAAAGRAPLPGEVATLTDAKDAAETVHGELLLRLVDELEAHRLPPLATKAGTRFRMSRSWRRILFSRRSRFSSAAISGDADPTGASAAGSQLRPIQRTSVESPTPRPSAISRWGLPLARTRRTFSSSNSAVNRRCCFMRVLLHHRDLSTFPRQDQCGLFAWLRALHHARVCNPRPSSSAASAAQSRASPGKIASHGAAVR